MAVVQEFDLDIKPSKLVNGQGLCKLAAKAQDQANQDPGWDNEIALWRGEETYISSGLDSWYKDLAHLLHHGTCPKNLNTRERRAL